MKWRSILFALAVCACSLSSASAFEGDRGDGVFAALGYRIKKIDNAAPTPWEKQNYATLGKARVEIKSKKALPSRPNTFYRFTVVEERYADAARAERRLADLREMPPGLSPEDAKAFPLRTGFRRRAQVYIVSTDAAMFETEMHRVANGLQAALK